MIDGQASYGQICLWSLTEQPWINTVRYALPNELQTNACVHSLYVLFVQMRLVCNDWTRVLH